MTDESSSASHLSDASTTTKGTTITGGYTMTSSSSLGTELYFYLAVVVIGVIGTAANALILYALVASEQHKKHVLIVNQNALDLYGCIFLIITYSVKLCNVHLTGWLGYWLCKLLFTDNILWWGVLGSIINLAIIAIERYLKVVHAQWSNIKLRSWQIYSAMAFAWIGAIVYINTLCFLTSTVINGVCYTMILKTDYNIFLHFLAITIYVIILLIFMSLYS